MKRATLLMASFGLVVCQAETRLGFSTYVGGSHDDDVRRVALDASGNVYVVGRTKSADLPQEGALKFAAPAQTQCTVGSGTVPFQYLCPAATGYFAVIRADGSKVRRSSYFGDVSDIAVDSAGNAYLGGTLDPRVMAATQGAWQTQPQSATKTGFIARLRPDGTVAWLSYVGGPVVTVGVDGAGNVYAAGQTDTAGWATSGAYQREIKGSDDVFAVKLSPAGDRAIYATLLGGTGKETLVRMSVGQGGALTVAGTTESKDLPLTAGAMEGLPAGQFVATVTPDGSGLSCLTYFSRATIADVAVTAAGEAWLVGDKSGRVYAGRLSAAGRQMVAETSIPGAAARAVRLDASENVYIVGQTSSRSFPTTVDAFQRYFRGGVAESTDVFNNKLLAPTGDAFLMQLAPNGRMVSASYLGGNNMDEASVVAVLSEGIAVVAGRTRSSDFPVSTGAAKESYQRGKCETGSAGPNGPRDYHLLPWPCDEGFVTRLELDSSQAALSLVNSASLQATAIAPGTLITLFGSKSPFGAGLGPEQGVGFAPDANGSAPTTLGGTQVLFDGTPSPVLYAQSSQVNVIVPFSVAGRKSVEVVVMANGRRAAARRWPVSATSPALFTMGEGIGQAAALNADGTLNSAANPAARGSFVVLFATGGGVMKPPSPDGKLTTAPYPVPEKPVAVWIGRKLETFSLSVRAGHVPMEILYAGAAPGLVAGALQINAKVPDEAEVGAATSILLEIDGYGLLETTIAVK